MEIQTTNQKYTQSIDNGLFGYWNQLPNELKRLVLDYGTWYHTKGYIKQNRSKYESVDTGVEFLGQLLRMPFGSDDTKSYYYTGMVRVLFVGTGWNSGLRQQSFYPNDDTYKRGLQPGIRVFRNAEDLRLCKSYRLYESIIIRSRLDPVAVHLRESTWHDSSRHGDFTYRTPEGMENQDEIDRLYSQCECVASYRDCKTHYFRLDLIGHRQDEIASVPGEEDEANGDSSDEESTGPDFIDDLWETEEEIRERTGDSIQTHGPVAWGKYEYGDFMLLCPKGLFRGIPNGHLKETKSNREFIPLSWRFSVFPRWNAKLNSAHMLPKLDTPVVAGTRLFTLQQVLPLNIPFGFNWIPYTEDRTRDHIFSTERLGQYYHAEIEPSMYPQPSFIETICNYPNGPVIPLLYERRGRCRRQLGIAYMSLHNGLLADATELGIGDGFDTEMGEQDNLYI